MTLDTPSFSRKCTFLPREPAGTFRESSRLDSGCSLTRIVDMALEAFTGYYKGPEQLDSAIRRTRQSNFQEP
jgi:hypothetical protein